MDFFRMVIKIKLRQIIAFDKFPMEGHYFSLLAKKFYALATGLPAVNRNIRHGGRKHVCGDVFEFFLRFIYQFLLSFRDKIFGVHFTLQVGPEILDGTQLGDVGRVRRLGYHIDSQPLHLLQRSLVNGPTPDPARIPLLRPYGIS